MTEPTWIITANGKRLGDVQAFTEDDAYNQACEMFPDYEDSLSVELKS